MAAYRAPEINENSTHFFNDAISKHNNRPQGVVAVCSQDDTHMDIFYSDGFHDIQVCDALQAKALFSRKLNCNAKYY